MNVYDSHDNILISDVLITRDAQHEEELMKSDFVKLSWDSATGTELPVDTYIIPYADNVRYRLLEPYYPEQKTENSWHYEPQFQHPKMYLGKVFFTRTSYENGDRTKPIPLIDWSYTGFVGTLLQYFCDAINDALGLSGNDIIEPVSVGEFENIVSTSFTAQDILSALTNVANQLECEWHIDWSQKTLYFGHIKIDRSEPSQPVLEVDSNIAVPSVRNSKEGYWNAYQPQGSSRNITVRASSGENVQANVRLALNKATYPDGIIYTDGEGHTLTKAQFDALGLIPYIKSVIYENVYPKLDLFVYDVRYRERYLLDENGDKVIDHYEGTTPVYKRYAVWYFQLAYPTYNQQGRVTEWTHYTIDPETQVIDGKALMGAFQANTRENAETSPLAGQGSGDGDGHYGFELRYHETEETIQPGADGEGDTGVVYDEHTLSKIKVGDYEIIFQQKDNLIIPTTKTIGMIPKGVKVDGAEVTDLNSLTNKSDGLKGNVVNLYNIVMSDDYLVSAQNELKNETLKTIAHDTEDNNTYTFKALETAFVQSNLDLYIGRKVTYRNGDYELETRVMKLVTKLDYSFDQEITVGNEVIKGNQTTMREKVDTLVTAFAQGGGGMSQSQIQRLIQNWVTPRFLSKLNDDTAQGWITVLSGLRTLEEFAGNSSSQGGGIYQGQDGKAHLVADVAKVRDMIEGILRIGDASNGGSSFDDGTTIPSNEITLKVHDVARFDDILIALAGIYTNLIKSDNYNGDGAFDTGFFIGKDSDGNSYAVFDKLFVRMKAIFNELEIRKISYAGGNFIFSHAGSTIVGVKNIVKTITASVVGTVLTLSGPVNVVGSTLNIDGGATVSGKNITLTSNPVTYAYRCYMKADDGTTSTENWWHVNDQARCQESGIQETGVYHDFETKFYWRRVLAVGHENISLEEGQEAGEYNYIDLSVVDCLTGSDIPQAGDQIVQMGNRTDTDRQGFVSLEVEGEYAPSFKVYRNVTSYTLENKRRICLSPKYTELHVNRLVVETEYDAQIVPMQRGEWSNIPEHKCYYYDLVQHNGSSWLCIYPESGIGGVKYTTEEPSENSEYWQYYAKKGTDGRDGKSFNILGSYDTVSELIADHPTGSVGDAYIVDSNLFVWDEEHGEWHDSGQIKGDTGRGISSVTISYGKSNSSAVIPSDWESSVDALNIQAGDYLFTRMVVNYTYGEPAQGEPSYSIGYIGRDGSSPVVGDIDNEVISIACDASGKTISAGSRDIGVAIYNGQQPVTLNNISVPSVPSGLSVVTDKVNGKIRISWEQGVSLSEVSNIVVKPNAIIDGVTYDRTLGVTVNGVRPGADGTSATIYDLIVTLSSIKKYQDGTPAVAVVSATRQKTVGDVITPDTTDGTFKYKIDGGAEQTYTNKTEIQTSTITTGIEFIFRVDGKIVDRETIPVVSDGTDGVSAAIAVASDNVVSIPTDATGHALTAFTEDVNVIALVDGTEIGKTQLLIEEQTSGDTYITVQKNVLSVMPWVDVTISGANITIPQATISGTMATLPTGDYAAVNGDLAVRVSKGALLNEHNIKVTVVGKDASGKEYTAVTYFTIQRNLTADGYIQEYTQPMSSEDVPPTVETYDDFTWSSEAHTPTQQLQDVYIALWTCNVNGEKISLVSVSLFSHFGDKGEGGTYKSTCFCRTNKDISASVPSGGTYDNAVPSNMIVSGETIVWSDGMPNGDARLWSTTAKFNADGIVGTWSLPVKVVDNDDTDIEFSDLVNYHPIPEDPNQRDAAHWYDPSRSTGVDWTTMIYRAERHIVNGVPSNSWVITRIKGEKGDSITKLSDTYRYATNNTGVRPPASSSDWKTTKPTLQQGYWLYTETTIHWSDNSTTVLYSDERNPNDGETGQDIVVDGATEMKYCCNQSNTTHPAENSSEWKDLNQITQTQGWWLWSKATTWYKKAESASGSHDAGKSVVYNVGYIAEDGDTPEDARGISSITEYYKATNSDSPIPTPTSDTGWSDNPNNAGWDGSHIYLWNYEKTTYNKAPTIERTTPKIVAIWTEDGKGIDSVTNWYAVNNNPSTAPSSGWTSSPVAPTEQSPYLWNYEVVSWTDGTSTGSVADAHVIGHYGKDGLNGLPAAYLNLSNTSIDIEVDENGIATNDFHKEITYTMDAVGKTLFIKSISVPETAHVSKPAYTLSALKNGIITISGTVATITESATVSGTRATLSSNYVALPQIIVSANEGDTVTENNVTVNGTAVDADGNEYTAISLFTITRQYYAPALQVVLSSEVIILTQNDSTQLIDLTSAYTNVSLRIGGTDITEGLAISLETEHCNASASGNTVSITDILTYQEEGKTLYYDNGYVDITITYRGVPYTKRWQFYCNLLGTWKETVENDTETAVAAKITYGYDHKTGLTGSLEAIGKYIRSSEENISTIQSDVYDGQGNVKLASKTELKQTADSISLSVYGQSGINLLSGNTNVRATSDFVRDCYLYNGRSYTFETAVTGNGTAMVALQKMNTDGTSILVWLQQVGSGVGQTTISVKTFNITEDARYQIRVSEISGVTIDWVQIEQGTFTSSNAVYHDVSTDLQRTGINIFNGIIILDANTVRINNGTTTAAMFTNGKIKGTYLQVTNLEAVSGTIGGFSVAEHLIKSSNDKIILNDNGSATIGKMSVDTSGNISATDVDLTGKITATSGKIGNFLISNGVIKSSESSPNILLDANGQSKIGNMTVALNGDITVSNMTANDGIFKGVIRAEKGLAYKITQYTIAVNASQNMSNDDVVVYVKTTGSGGIGTLPPMLYLPNPEYGIGQMVYICNREGSTQTLRIMASNGHNIYPGNYSYIDLVGNGVICFVFDYVRGQWWQFSALNT